VLHEYAQSIQLTLIPRADEYLTYQFDFIRADGEPDSYTVYWHTKKLQFFQTPGDEASILTHTDTQRTVAVVQGASSMSPEIVKLRENIFAATKRILQEDKDFEIDIGEVTALADKEKGRMPEGFPDSDGKSFTFGFSLGDVSNLTSVTLKIKKYLESDIQYSFEYKNIHGQKGVMRMYRDSDHPSRLLTARKYQIWRLQKGYDAMRRERAPITYFVGNCKELINCAIGAFKIEFFCFSPDGKYRALPAMNSVRIPRTKGAQEVRLTLIKSPDREYIVYKFNIISSYGESISSYDLSWHIKNQEFHQDFNKTPLRYQALHASIFL